MIRTKDLKLINQAIRTLNESVESHNKTLAALLDTISELSSLSQHTADLILQHINSQNSQEIFIEHDGI